MKCEVWWTDRDGNEKHVEYPDMEFTAAMAKFNAEDFKEGDGRPHRIYVDNTKENA